MDLYTAFTNIPKEELSDINEPSWIEEHRTRPINLNYSKSIKPPIIMHYNDGTSDTFKFLSNHRQVGVLFNTTYVKQKEEG